jgi:hypothetical protein
LDLENYSEVAFTALPYPPCLILTIDMVDVYCGGNKKRVSIYLNNLGLF